MGAYQKLLKIGGHEGSVLLGSCVWCTTGRATTKDHLVPLWLRKSAVDLPGCLPLHTVASCATCNNRKGPLPGAVFARLRDPDGYVRRSNPEWQKANGHWLSIAVYMKGRRMLELPEPLVAYVLEAFSEPAGLDLPPMVREGWEREQRRAEARLADYERRLIARQTGPRPPTLAAIWPELVR